MAINNKNYITTAIGTSNTSVYNPTTAGIQSTVIGLNVANILTTPVTVSVTLGVSGSNAYLIRNTLIPAGNALNLLESNKLIVGQNNTLYVSSNTASSVDVTVSVIEVS